MLIELIRSGVVAVEEEEDDDDDDDDDAVAVGRIAVVRE